MKANYRKEKLNRKRMQKKNYCREISKFRAPQNFPLFSNSVHSGKCEMHIMSLYILKKKLTIK